MIELSLKLLIPPRELSSNVMLLFLPRCSILLRD
uniref:Uncharacterized protein n=1 Tax=Podoviridae sp. ct8Lf7 TaxID=2827723 RepID=A0A8S5S164_9CAUD|nr:MAG TPA: hypothetical protein [Podoviridae sp. ct8Lf7]